MQRDVRRWLPGGQVQSPPALPTHHPPTPHPTYSSEVDTVALLETPPTVSTPDDEVIDPPKSPVSLVNAPAKAKLTPVAAPPNSSVVPTVTAPVVSTLAEYTVVAPVTAPLEYLERDAVRR